MHRHIIWLVAACLCAATLGEAEIISVRINWTPSVCTPACAELAQKRLSEIKATSQVIVNQASGEAQLVWKPNFPFSYDMVRVAVARVGLSIRDWNIKVRGTIQRKGEKVYLVSIGDNTRFGLFSPAQAQPGRFVMRASMATHPLEETLKHRLLGAEKDNEIVTLEGELYLPYRAPLSIIIRQVSFSGSENKQDTIQYDIPK